MVTVISDILGFLLESIIFRAIEAADFGRFGNEFIPVRQLLD